MGLAAAGDGLPEFLPVPGERRGRALVEKVVFIPTSFKRKERGPGSELPSSIFSGPGHLQEDLSWFWDLVPTSLRLELSNISQLLQEDLLPTAVQPDFSGFLPITFAVP